MKSIIFLATVILFLILLIFAMSQVKVEGAEIEWTGIVIHYSASDFGTVKEIDMWHKERGFDEIGYHYVIYKYGGVHKGRSLDKVGAHARGRNETHIGICLIGKDMFCGTQLNDLKNLCRKLKEKYPIKSIERHHEECPGKGIPNSIFFDEVEIFR